MSYKRPHKYGARAVVIDGIRFASKREAARYGELKLLARAGRITSLRVHPSFVLQEKFERGDGTKVRAIVYTADFAYCEGGKQVVEDVKGVETPVWRLKRRMFWRRFPEVELRVIK